MWRNTLMQEINTHFSLRNSIHSRPVPNRKDNEPESDMFDMRKEDGLFQQGKIVDCVEGGLMVDWDCETEPSPHFVPFGEMYLNRRPFCLDNRNEDTKTEMPVEVLLCRSPKEPKMWHPGKFIAGEFSSSVRFGIVSVTLPEGARGLVVPAERIRVPPSKDEPNRLRVQQAHFIKQTLSLPAKFSHGKIFARQMLDALNQNGSNRVSTFSTRTFIKALHMDAKSLTCIRIGYDIVPEDQQYHTSDQLHTELMWAARKCLLPNEYEKPRNKRKCSKTDLKSPSKKRARNKTSATTTFAIQFLPMHILVDVFHQLSTTEQCHLRPVCVAWNATLTSSCVTRMLRVHSEGEKQNLMSVASLHHGRTPDTRIILNAGSDAAGQYAGDAPLLCSGQLVHTLVEKKLHAPVVTMVLADLVWNIKVVGYHDRFADLFGRFVEELNSFTAVCGTLLLRNLKVCLERDCWPYRATFIRILTGRIVGSLTVQQVWSWVNCSLPSLANTQYQLLADWIADSGRHEREQPAILNLLNDRQSNDPRENAHYRGRRWTVPDLATVELHKLSKLTLHSLMASKDRTSLVIPFSYG